MTRGGGVTLRFWDSNKLLCLHYFWDLIFIRCWGIFGSAPLAWPTKSCFLWGKADDTFRKGELLGVICNWPWALESALQHWGNCPVNASVCWPPECERGNRLHFCISLKIPAPSFLLIVLQIVNHSVVSDFCEPKDCNPPGTSLSMEFSRQGHWSGSPFPSPGTFPTQGLNLGSTLQTDCLLTEPPILQIIIEIFLSWYSAVTSCFNKPFI